VGSGQPPFQGSFYQNQAKQQVNARGGGQARVQRRRYDSAPASLSAAPDSIPESLMKILKQHEAEPVGACLKGKESVWAEAGASPWLQNVVQEGYFPAFIETPNTTSCPPFTVHSMEKTKQLDEIVSQLLAKKAIVRIKNPQSDPGFYSYFFVRPKKTGGLRPIFNMKPLNKFVAKETFKMETPIAIAESMERGTWACSLDLSDAYLHVPMHTAVQKYLRFTHNKKAYQFRSLPFGLNVSAWIFTKIASVAVSRLHQKGIAVSAYIDDWVIHNTDPNRLEEQRNEVIDFLLRLGWHINTAKSALVPTQTFVYLGVQFDTRLGILSNTLEKAKEVAELARELLRKRVTTPRTIRKLVGKLTFVMHYVQFGKSNTRPIQWLLKELWDRTEETLDSKHAVLLTPSLFQALQRWSNLEWSQSGVPMHTQQPMFSLHTDASTTGWGAVLTETLESRIVKTFKGEWSLEFGQRHSNARELQAVFQALMAAEVNSTSVKLFSDNTSVVAIVNRQGTVLSSELQGLAQTLFDFLQEKEILIKAAHIPGSQNIHADLLSRQDKIFATEWRLQPLAFRNACLHYNFQPQIDAFATALTTQLPLYFSPVPDAGAAGLDAFAQSWDGWDLYLFPPFSLFSQVISKLRRSRQTTALIVYPAQPRKAWFPGLQKLMVAPPIQLPQYNHVLTQPHSRARHPALRILKLHAVLCRSGTFEQRV
jgi:hypothetical protein